MENIELTPAELEMIRIKREQEAAAAAAAALKEQEEKAAAMLKLQQKKEEQLSHSVARNAVITEIFNKHFNPTRWRLVTEERTITNTETGRYIPRDNRTEENPQEYSWELTEDVTVENIHVEHIESEKCVGIAIDTKPHPYRREVRETLTLTPDCFTLGWCGYVIIDGVRAYCETKGKIKKVATLEQQMQDAVNAVKAVIIYKQKKLNAADDFAQKLEAAKLIYTRKDSYKSYGRPYSVRGATGEHGVEFTVSLPNGVIVEYFVTTAVSRQRINFPKELQKTEIDFLYSLGNL